MLYDGRGIGIRSLPAAAAKVIREATTAIPSAAGGDRERLGREGV